MTQATLFNLINQLELLDLEELQTLSQVIQVRLNTVNQFDNLAKFHDALLASGLGRQLKPVKTQLPAQRTLIKIKEKPISETIIEERR